MKHAVMWRANKTDKPQHPPVANWWLGSLGFHTYHLLLYIAQWVPSLLPTIERLFVNVQFGFKEHAGSSAVQDGHTGLLMNCLYSQFVNEWAIPLHKGPEAISRLSAWLHGDKIGSRIPVDPKGVYVHAPIEVRVTVRYNLKAISSYSGLSLSSETCLGSNCSFSGRKTPKIC